MGKRSRAVGSIVVHVFVGFVIQLIIISVSAFLIKITQFLYRTMIIIWNESTKMKDLPISFSASDKHVPSNIPRFAKSTRDAANLSSL